jgi:hypothetical protein
MRLGSWVSSLFHRRSVHRAEPSSTTPRPPPPAPLTTTDTFDPAAPMRVSIGKTTGFSPLEKQKLDRAMVKLGQVLNSREFKDAVLSHRFEGKPGFANDSRTPAEVYAVIRAAKETFTQVADGEVDLNVELKSLSWFQRGVVGYTTPSSDTVTTNRRFYSGFDESDIAGHLGHEWLHKLGFEHDFKATARRPHSVPYALGELIESLAARPSLTPL